MKLLKIETVATDAIVANTGFIVNVDVDNLEINIGATGTTTTVVGPFGTITFTVDGADPAEKLANAGKLGDYFAGLVQEMCGPAGNQKKVYEFFPGGSYANLESATGIVNTGSTGPLVTVALS
jgi:hypothetical protein